MLKFLRKYRTVFLAFFIVVLMIAFVAPQAIQQLGPNPMKQKAGDIGGEPFTVADLQRAASEVRMLESIDPTIPMLIGLEPGRQPEHWMLLKLEADRAGLIGEGEDGRDWLPEVATQIVRIALSRNLGAQAQQYISMLLQSPQVQQEIADRVTMMQSRVAGAAGNAMLTEAEGFRVLAAARGIIRLKDAYVFAARPTTSQTVSAARRFRDSATIDYIFLPGSALASEVPEPTEDELKAHFDEYASVDPGTGEYGIGYRESARVKVEWLTIDRNAISGALPIDRVELRKLYESNRTKYPSDYEVEREIVKADYMEARTAEIVTEIVRVVRAEVLKATRRLEVDGTYKKLPDAWASERPKLEQIAQAIVDSIKSIKGVTIPLPRVESRDAAWSDAQALSALPGIGGAIVRLGNVQAPFPQYALQVKELDGNPTLGLQVGLTQIDSPAEDSSRNLYFFTVLDARQPSPPDSMADVATLRDDWKAIRGYQRLVAEQGVYETLARTDSLEAVARLIDTDGTKLLFPMNAVTISRAGAQTADRNVQDRAFSDAVMDAVSGLDPKLTPEALQGEPNAVLSVAIPSRLGIAVVRVREIRPYTIEQFRSEAVGMVAQAAALEVEAVAEDIGTINPFTYEAMVKRLRFEAASGEKSDS